MLLIGLGAFVYAWFSAASPNVTREGIQSYAVGEMSRLQFQRAGEPISEAEFQAPDGSTATLADYTGRILVVNFWGTTCAPCVLEMPTLAALQNEFDESDLLVMPLSFDRVGDYPMARERLEARRHLGTRAACVGGARPAQVASTAHEEGRGDAAFEA